MRRCSKLGPCGAASALAEQFPESGRAAVVGTAFHGVVRSWVIPGPPDCLDHLTPEERADVTGWLEKLASRWPLFPEEVRDTVHAEIPVALDSDGMLCEPGSPDAITQGTADLCWVHDGVLHVLDYKTGWLEPEGGPMCLQLQAYGLGLAAKFGASKLKLGLWRCRMAEPLSWSDVVDLDGEGASEMWSRVRAAALLDERPVTGDHCARCFQRLHCPARQLAALQSRAKLAKELQPFTRAGGLTLDNIGRGVAVLEQLRAMAKTLTEMADVADEAIEALVRSHSGPVALGDGRELAVVPTSGKRSGPTVGELEKAGLSHLIKPAKQGTKVVCRKAVA